MRKISVLSILSLRCVSVKLRQSKSQKISIICSIICSLPEIVQYSPYYLPLNVFAASKGSNLYILFAITAAGVVPCGGPKKSPRTSSIVQIIFLFRSFEVL